MEARTRSSRRLRLSTRGATSTGGFATSIAARLPGSRRATWAPRLASGRVPHRTPSQMRSPSSGSATSIGVRRLRPMAAAMRSRAARSSPTWMRKRRLGAQVLKTRQQRPAISTSLNPSSCPDRRSFGAPAECSSSTRPCSQTWNATRCSYRDSPGACSSSRSSISWPAWATSSEAACARCASRSSSTSRRASR